MWVDGRGGQGGRTAPAAWSAISAMYGVLYTRSLGLLGLPLPLLGFAMHLNASTPTSVTHSLRRGLSLPLVLNLSQTLPTKTVHLPGLLTFIPRRQAFSQSLLSFPRGLLASWPFRYAVAYLYLSLYPYPLSRACLCCIPSLIPPLIRA